jgi:hypothetical protein
MLLIAQEIKVKDTNLGGRMEINIEQARFPLQKCESNARILGLCFLFFES